MGLGRMAGVHPMVVPAPCYPHDLHHVPRLDDGGRHGSLPPLGPGGRGPRRDDCGGAVGHGTGVATRGVEEDEGPGMKVDPGCRP
jgi:hypothetical protein